MILLDQEVSQRPKLPTDPAVGPTNRVSPQTDPVVPGPSQRPPSPNTTLPDYDTSEAQQPSKPKRRFWYRFWHTRLGKLLSFAMVVYSAIFLVIGVPAFFLRSRRKSHKFKWGPDDLFGDDGPLRPPPSPGRKMMGQPSPQSLDDTSVSCNVWDESAALPGEPSTARAGTAAMILGFPLVERIALRLNASSGQLEDYVFGSLTVDMNPEKNALSTVLIGSAKYSNVSLLRATSVCLTRFGNTTEITIHTPERPANSSDVIEMDLQLLLPQTQTPIRFESFVTILPMFTQVLGNLPRVFFERIRLLDSGSSITVGSVSAASILVRTSGAEISGNFSASNRIYLDTINGGVYANVTLHNNKKLRKHTKLSVETGNGPIVAQVKLAVDERVFFSPPKHRNIVANFRTFNAPMNVSIAHVKRSKPARLDLFAENTLGPIDVTLDPLYKGIFDVHTKGATAEVQEMVISDPSAIARLPHHGHDGGDRDDDDDDDDDDKHELHFVRATSERARGWVGDSRRPEQFDRHMLSCVKIINSLSPIRLRLARFRRPTTVRR